MDEGMEMEPIGKIEIISHLEEPRFETESTDLSIQKILERVRVSKRITDDEKAALAGSLNALSESEVNTLVDELIRCLRSCYFAQRGNAICVLGLLGSRAVSAIAPIVQAMDCWSPNVVTQASEALAQIEPSQAAAVLAGSFYRIPEPGAKRLAWCSQDVNIVHCLEALGPSAVGAAPQLAAYMHSHRRTSHALISIGSGAIPAVLNEVCRATPGGYKWASKVAAEIFSAIGAEASQPLIAALESSKGEERLRLALLFAYLEPPALSVDALPVLNRLMMDPSAAGYAKRALDRLSRREGSLNEMADRVLVSVTGGRYILDRSKTEIGITDNAKGTEYDALVTRLIPLLQSEKHIEQVNTLYVLGLLESKASVAVPAIIEALDRMDCRAVMQAADTLPRIGADYAVPALIAVFPQVPPGLKITSWSHKNDCVLECLEVFGESLGKHASLLAGYLSTQSVNTVLANIGPEAIPAILHEVARKAIENDLSWTCECAAEVLSSIGASASQPLISALAESSDDTREAFSQVYSRLRPPALAISAAPVLSRLLLESPPGGRIRGNLKKALSNLGAAAAPDLFDAFAGNLTGQAPGQRDELRILDGLLQEYGQASIPVLTSHLPELNPADQANLASAILRIDANNDYAAEQLLLLLKNENPQVRAAAVKAVAGARDQRGAVSGLVKDKLLPAAMIAWQDPDAAVRGTATAFLSGMLSHDSRKNIIASVTVAKSRREKEQTNE